MMGTFDEKKNYEKNIVFIVPKSNLKLKSISV